MTIKELYKIAKLQGVEDWEVKIHPYHDPDIADRMTDLKYIAEFDAIFYDPESNTPLETFRRRKKIFSADKTKEDSKDMKYVLI